MARGINFILVAAPDLFWYRSPGQACVGTWSESVVGGWVKVVSVLKLMKLVMLEVHK